MKPVRLSKDGRTRLATSNEQLVRLRFDGWVAVPATSKKTRSAPAGSIGESTEAGDLTVETSGT
jgi:hypothetical protein